MQHAKLVHFFSPKPTCQAEPQLAPLHAASATMSECVVPRRVAVSSPAVEVGAALTGHLLPKGPLNARHIGQKSIVSLRTRNGMTTYISDEAADLLERLNNSLRLLLGFWVVARVVIVDGGFATRKGSFLAEELFDGFGICDIDRTNLKRG